MARLGDVCTIVSGTTPKSSCPEYWDGNINWVTPAELNDESDVIYESQRKITKQAVIDSSLKPFPAGTVLLSSRAPIGKVAIAGTEMYCNQGFKNLICTDAIYNRYLYHFLKGKTEYLNSLGRGATFKEISKSIVEEIEIPLPPLEEQRRIAALLDEVGDLIAKRQAQLDKLDLLVKSRFVEMFENGKKVKEVLLGDISEFVTVGIANSATYAYAKSGVVMLRNQNIKENYLDDSDLIFIKKEFADKYKTKSLKKNDILVIRTGYPGVACLVPAQYEGAQTFTTLIVRLKDSLETDPNFICHYINSLHGKAYVEGAKVGVAQQNFGAKALALMPIMLPQIELQNDFSNFCVQIDKLKFSVHHGLDKLELLKKALMQQYFR